MLDEELAARMRRLRGRRGAAVGLPGWKLQREMKYLTEFRNGEIAQRMAREIHAIATRPWKIMEVCGGQTHSIIKTELTRCCPMVSR